MTKTHSKLASSYERYVPSVVDSPVLVRKGRREGGREEKQGKGKRRKERQRERERERERERLW